MWAERDRVITKSIDGGRLSYFDLDVGETGKQILILSNFATLMVTELKQHFSLRYDKSITGCRYYVRTTNQPNGLQQTKARMEGEESVAYRCELISMYGTIFIFFLSIYSSNDVMS